MITRKQSGLQRSTQLFLIILITVQLLAITTTAAWTIAASLLSISTIDSDSANDLVYFFVMTSFPVDYLAWQAHTITVIIIIMTTRAARSSHQRALRKNSFRLADYRLVFGLPVSVLLK